MTILRNLSRAAIAALVILFVWMPTAPAEKVDPEAVIVPQQITFAYNLAPGAASPPVTVPAGVPVQVTGTCLSVGFRGIGHVSLLSIPGAGGFLEWVGLDSTAGAAITQGFSGAAGTKIVFIDFAHQVRIEVASPTQIRVRNTAAAPRAGRVSLTW
jgi:hypothetical protein